MPLIQTKFASDRLFLKECRRNCIQKWCIKKDDFNVECKLCIKIISCANQVKSQILRHAVGEKCKDVIKMPFKSGQTKFVTALQMAGSSSSTLASLQLSKTWNLSHTE